MDTILAGACIWDVTKVGVSLTEGDHDGDPGLVSAELLLMRYALRLARILTLLRQQLTRSKGVAEIDLAALDFDDGL